MLTVTHVDRPRNAVVRGDEYVPLSVNWVQVGSVRPIYYRIRSSDDGDVELKIEPLRGELIGAVVIDSPTRRVQVPKSIYISSLVTEGAVFVSLKKWNPNPDNVPTTEYVYEEGRLGWGEDATYLYYSFSDREPDRFIMAGNAGFGIMEPDLVTALISKKPLSGSQT
jgi:hypothetical protein